VQVALEELQLAAFRRHPYRQPTLGFASDIAGLTRNDAIEFLREHHGRAGIVTVLVGDFEVEAVKVLLDRYLAAPSGARTSPAIQIDEPPQNGERRVELNGSGSLVAVGWRVPARGHPDAPAVDVALRLLAHSRGARLGQRVVHQEALASSLRAVHAWPGDRYEHLAVVLAQPVAGVAPAELESLIHEEVARLAETGPDPAELAGVRRVARAERMRALRDAPELAALLAECQLETGDWRTLTRELEQLEAITVDQVQGVLQRYFTRAGRTVVTISESEEETR
jgi:predicted Zn-dependent peptidase